VTFHGHAEAFFHVGISGVDGRYGSHAQGRAKGQNQGGGGQGAGSSSHDVSPGLNLGFASEVRLLTPLEIAHGDALQLPRFFCRYCKTL
jgi:hypothetical protein